MIFFSWYIAELESVYFNQKASCAGCARITCRLKKRNHSVSTNKPSSYPLSIEAGVRIGTNVSSYKEREKCTLRRNWILLSNPKLSRHCSLTAESFVSCQNLQWTMMIIAVGRRRAPHFTILPKIDPNKTKVISRAFNCKDPPAHQKRLHPKAT